MFFSRFFEGIEDKSQDNPESFEKKSFTACVQEWLLLSIKNLDQQFGGGGEGLKGDIKQEEEQK